MAGIDRTRFIKNADGELDEFICGICLGILNKPVVTECCQQTYCSTCINQWLINKTTCPNDRSTLIKEGLRTPAKALTNFIDNLKVKCDYHLEGCQSVIKFGHLGQHIKSCEFRPNSLCKFCSKVRKSGSKHDCIETLLADKQRINAKNQRKNAENQRLNAENQRINAENQRLNAENQRINAENKKLIEDNNLIKQQSINDLKNYMIAFNQMRKDAENELNQTKINNNKRFCSLEAQLVNISTEIDSQESISIIIQSAKFNIDKAEVSKSSVGPFIRSQLILYCQKAIQEYDSIKSIKSYIESRSKSYLEGTPDSYKLIIPIDPSSSCDLKIGFGLLYIGFQKIPKESNPSTAPDPTI